MVALSACFFVAGVMTLFLKKYPSAALFFLAAAMAAVGSQYGPQ